MTGQSANKGIGKRIRKFFNYRQGRPKHPFDTSDSYWDIRYKNGGNSGSGSYGRLSTFKAQILNELVRDENINSVIELGCGDGNQLELAEYKRYTGVDVSAKAVEVCSTLFASDDTKKFMVLSAYSGETAELALSLDVIYHLVEDDVFEQYMTMLFASTTNLVVIYASNHDQVTTDAHVKHRKFTDWIDRTQRTFSLLRHIPNQYPFDKEDPRNTSFADFYIYRKNS